MTMFYDRVANDCTTAARLIGEMADRFRELDDPTMAGVADSVAKAMSRLAYDAAMTETQPIELPLKD